MSGRVLGPLCMATLVALYAGVGRDLTAGLLLMPLVWLPALLPWRARVSLLGQGLLSFLLLGLAGLLVRLLPGPQLPFRGVMGPLVPFLAVGAILIASHRLFLEEPAGGNRITAAHGFWCLVACGSQRSGLAYVLGCAIYLALVGTWLRGPGKPWALGRHRGWWASILALSGLVAGAFAWVIPKAHTRVVNWLIDSTPQIGLHDGPLELGSLEGLASSSRIVARIFHFEGDPLLRGVAYQDYSHGRWLTRQTVLSRSMPVSGAGGRVDIRMEATETPRFLAPLQAREIALNTPSALVDTFGILSPIYGASAQRVRYEPGPRDQFVPERVQPIDLVLPEVHRAKLTRIALRWIEGATSQEEQLRRLARALQNEHPYSTSFRRPPRMDPLIAFLETPGSGGHCEYFASAMALLARSIGIPTRVIGGYRVSEFNRVGGYHIVRENNAHAWIEAYLPEKGWVSVDATPAASLEVAGPPETPFFGAWLDAALTHGSVWFQWALDHPSTLVVALSPVVLFIFARELWSRWRAARNQKQPGLLEQVEPPRPYVQKLLDALAARGVIRGPSESLEAFADRLNALGHGEEVGLLRSYAAFRYGGVGDEGALREAFERCSLRLRGIPRVVEPATSLAEEQRALREAHVRALAEHASLEEHLALIAILVMLQHAEPRVTVLFAGLLQGRSKGRRSAVLFDQLGVGGGEQVVDLLAGKRRVARAHQRLAGGRCLLPAMEGAATIFVSAPGGARAKIRSHQTRAARISSSERM